MGVILFLILVVFLVYAMAIRPKQVAGKIMVRLSAGDKVPDGFNYQDIAALLQSATWIKDKKEITERITNPENPFGSVEVICKGITYRLVLSRDESNTSKLTVSTVLKSGYDDIKHIRYQQEANRIRCYIMEQIDPNFTEQPKAYYSTIRTMFLMRYSAISVMVAFCCYAILPEILNRILGADVNPIYMLCAALVAGLCICFGVALPGYLEQTRSEELLDGIPVREYMDHESIMQLLQEKLRLKSLKSLYYDETGTVSIKGRCGTYHVMISPEHPKLFVTVESGKNARAYQEAYYIRCAIIKIFDSAYPENAEKAHGLLTTVRRGRLLTYLAAFIFIVLIVVPVLSSTYGSSGISNSYLSQYSDTVTVGEAFDQFFAEPNWESYKVGSQKYVDFRGGCTLWGEPATMVITFFLGNHDTFHVSNIMINGQDLPELSWPLILETIYSDEVQVPDTNEQANVSNDYGNIWGENTGVDENVESMPISYQCDFDSGDYAIITITHHAEITDSDNQFIAADYVLGSTNKVLIHLEGYATTISDTEYILDDPSGVSLDIERLNFDELVVTTSGENLHGITFAGEYYAF